MLSEKYIIPLGFGTLATIFYLSRKYLNNIIYENEQSFIDILFNEQDEKNLVKGKDGLNAYDRRELCHKKLYENSIDVTIGTTKYHNGDSIILLRMIISIPNREEKISALFSPNAITCMVETNMGLSEKEMKSDLLSEYVKNNDDCIYRFQSSEEFLECMFALKEINVIK